MKWASDKYQKILTSFLRRTSSWDVFYWRACTPPCDWHPQPYNNYFVLIVMPSWTPPKFPSPIMQAKLNMSVQSKIRPSLTWKNTNNFTQITRQPFSRPTHIIVTSSCALFVDLNAILFVTCCTSHQQIRTFLQHVETHKSPGKPSSLDERSTSVCLFAALIWHTRDLSHSNYAKELKEWCLQTHLQRIQQNIKRSIIHSGCEKRQDDERERERGTGTWRIGNWDSDESLDDAASDAPNQSRHHYHLHNP